MTMVNKTLRAALFVSIVQAAPAAAAFQAAPPPGRAPTPLDAVRAVDARVTAVGHRLAVGSVALCANRAWLPGIALHHLAQYGPDERTELTRASGLGPRPAVLAVAADGGAAQAGLRADDEILALDGRAMPIAPLPARPDFAPVEAALDALDEAFADGAAAVEVLRAGRTLSLTIRAERGCASRFLVVPSAQRSARADGRHVRVTGAMGEFARSDNDLAALLAHELAHNILEHRVRLDAAGVRRGFLRNFGRSARAFRIVEDEADRLSIYMLDRAGFDPGQAMSFWERFSQAGLNFIGSTTHGSWRTRLAAMREEVEAIRRARASGGTAVPPFMAGRMPPPDSQR